jgi:hypothetical protein
MSILEPLVKIENIFGYLNGFQTTKKSLKHAFHHPRTKPSRITQ